MRNAPSAELTNLLEKLGLASPTQVKSVSRFAQSLAKGVPLFDSVWVDALVRRRLLTPYQAAEINAGRGEHLGIGPLVLINPPKNLGFAQQFTAREVAGELPVLTTIAKVTPGEDKKLKSMQEFAEQLSRAHQAETALSVLPLQDLGQEGDRLWISQRVGKDRSAGEWLLRGGRLPGEVVLEVARQMAQALAQLEQFSLVHGDISANSVHLSESGEVTLYHAGLRTIIRPAEGYAHADLPTEAYDYLAPERVANGTKPNTSSDLFACGCLWWQLLTGRAPLAGGDSLAKVKAAHASRIIDISRFAPEAPALLKQAITQVTSRETELRGDSFAELSGLLGEPTEVGKILVVHYLGSLSTRSLTASQPARSNQESKAKSLLVRGFGWLRNALPGNPWSSENAAADSDRGGIISWGFNWARRLMEYKRLATAAVGMLSLIISSWSLWWGSSENVAEKQPSSLIANQNPALLSEDQVAQAKPLTLDAQEAGTEKQITTLPDSIQLVSATQPVGGDPQNVAPPYGPSPSHARRETQEIILPTGRIVQASTLELHPGIRISPPAGQRAKIQVPAGGWMIDEEQVRIENVDFVPAVASGEPSEAKSKALIRLNATSAQFHGCSFQTLENQSHQHLAAIHWSRPYGDQAIDRLPAAGHLLLANCILSSVHTGIDCQMTGPVVLELDNVLLASPAEAAHSGTLWRIDHSPTAEDDFVLRMNACAVRDAMSLIDFYCPDLPTELGHIRIDARDCVIAPRSSGALFRFVGPYRPDRVLKNLSWEGQGSLLPSAGRFGLWYDAQGSPHKIEDIGVSIDGLVRGGFEFAGKPSRNGTDSVLTHWAAPLLGDSRPGVRAAALPVSGLK